MKQKLMVTGALRVRQGKVQIPGGGGGGTDGGAGGKGEKWGGGGGKELVGVNWA